MTEWTEALSWSSEAGVDYSIEERYSRSKEVYEIKLLLKARDTWFVRNRWESEDGISSDT